MNKVLRKLAIVLLLCGYLAPREASAICHVLLTPVEIFVAAGQLDVKGNVSTTSCACGANNIVSMDLSGANEAMMSRWQAIFMAGQLSERQVLVFSSDVCAACWFSPGCVKAGAVILQ